MKTVQMFSIVLIVACNSISFSSGYDKRALDRKAALRQKLVQKKMITGEEAKKRNNEEAENINAVVSANNKILNSLASKDSGSTVNFY
jgi:hypothetical protein